MQEKEMDGVEYLKKIRVSYLCRTATTYYPCCIPALGGFVRSWSHKTYPRRKSNTFSKIQTNYYLLFLVIFAIK